ncbi:T9SS type B sorting domain-containing protein [Flavobacterium sp. JAS]|uniref:T9SS type B sorting domain-containing protein n=1 Tax=Flavobacterium sp. JAS TaxID=2897329 RepID=UPI001E51AEBC|nr:T9SS type B sorting domain-containing protein [Flavobacterium sp. JAS]MCD0472315.1 T9SS type B sorting domain-containing protein [Flavobacterium sp. JAS]
MNLHHRRYLSCLVISRIAIIIFFTSAYTINAQCTVQTINNDFELPVVSQSAAFLNQREVPGWRTTAPDGIIEFWKNGSLGGFAYSGEQYIELNAFSASGLYQDFDSSRNTVFNYSFAHRGRVGTDKMVVRAGPPAGPYTIINTVSTGNLQWKLYSGSYTAPKGQKSTRFIFEAVSTASGDPTVGNFLDAINFSGKIAAPTITGEQTICAGTSASLTALGQANSTVNWYDKNGGLIHSGSTFVSPPLLNDTSYSVEQVNALGCKSDLEIVKINVTSKAKIEVALSGATSICSGEFADISFKSTSPDVNYQWTVTQTGVSGAIAGSGNRINELLKATSTTVGIAKYSIVPILKGCMGEPIIVEIKVNPLEQAVETSEMRICSKESVKINLSSYLKGTVFTWRAVSSNVRGASEGSGGFIDQILEASTIDQGSVLYTVTTENQGCGGEMLVLKVVVDPLAEVVLNDGTICRNPSTGEVIKTYPLESNLSSADYEFEWYYNSIKIDNAVSDTFDADKEGAYSVIATNRKTGCISSPAGAKVESFSSSGADLELSIKQIPGFSDYNSRVLITTKGGSGRYQYQLDNDDFLGSNEFYNVKPGAHTITVRDPNGCVNISKRFFVIWYPTFFTPNGDGFNDTWNIYGLEDQSLFNVNIFDRYGKLLKQLTSKDQGWNGLYNGTDLPSSDYWFSGEYIDEGVTNKFKAHFSLKR